MHPWIGRRGIDTLAQARSKHLIQQDTLVYDMIIAGAGPVGLFLACELRLGKRDGSRAANFTHLKYLP
jgi:hypothetical protein